MSLKAKLEAVIYAAEEPITLAQLALLFTAEALEWKAEQEAAAAAASPESSPDAGEALPLLEDTSESPAADATTPNAAEAPEAQPLEAVAAEAVGEPAAETSAEIAPADAETTAIVGDSGEAAPAEASEAAEAGESELKRQARQRDRDVRNVLRLLLDELIAEYASDERGIEIREVAGGYRMATKPECHDAVRGFVKSLKPPLKLSLPALETLAVIAYKQPVTAPEVNEIRGVDSSGVFGSLLSRKLIATAGRKQVVGRPILYKTTKEFLLRFGLKDISELPSMEEFEKLAVSELEEAEPEAAEEASAGESPELTEQADEEPEGDTATSNPTEEPAAEETMAGDPGAAAPVVEEPAAEEPVASVPDAEPAEIEQIAHE